MIDTMKEIDADWTQHPDVTAAGQAEKQADAVVAEAERACDECAAWKVSPDPFQQLRYRVEYPALELAVHRARVDQFKAQEARKDVERAAKMRVQPWWNEKFRQAWLAIEAAATGPLFDAVKAWEEVVATKAASIAVPCFLPPDWHTAAILDVVRHIREKDLHLDDRF